MERIYINRKWNYIDVFEEKLITSFSKTGETVDLPHTVALTSFHYFDESIYQKHCCYQKEFYAKAEWEEGIVFVTFFGVAHRARVYVNGALAGEHRCGYTAFRVRIDPHLRFAKKNRLVVEVDSRESLDQPPFGHVTDYMTYGGIYRDVCLEIADPVHMKDLAVRPSFTELPKTRGVSLKRLKEMERQGRINTEITLSDEAKRMAAERRLYVCQFLDGKQISNQPLGIGGMTTTLAGKVKLWDIGSPTRYLLRTELRLDGETVDTHEIKIGFRDIQWKRNGLFLNGRRVKLRGLNRHQSYPYIGYAAPARLQRMDAHILKHELSLNAVRTSHYPQSQDFLDACDAEGLLVFTEIPGWQHIGGEEWKEIALLNVSDMVRQCRNHPSVILWGVRINESKDDDDFYEKTNGIAHELDPTRPTGGVRCEKQMHLLEDVYTYNDFSFDGTNEGCEKKSAVSPDGGKPYLISEYNGHMFPSKSFDAEEHRLEHALRHAAVIDAINAYDDILGGFGWCMCDYNTRREFGSGDRVCYHGVMDMFRNPKLAAYIYASQTERKDVLAVSSSFDLGEHPECVRGQAAIITNAEKVRMYKDGRLLKEYAAADSPYSNMRHGPLEIDEYVGDGIRGEGLEEKQLALIRFCLNEAVMNGKKVNGAAKRAAAQLILRYHMKKEEIPALIDKYMEEWGTGTGIYRFEAVRDGKTVKTAEYGPFESVQIRAEADTEVLCEEHTYDMALVRIKAVDDFGHVVPYFDEPLTAKADGPVEIVGPKLSVFRGGMTGLFVKTTGEAGRARIRLHAEGAASAEIRFEIKIKEMEG